MIAVVKNTATDDQLDHLIRWIEERGFKTHISQGDHATIVGIIGDTSQIDPFLLESMSIIEHVQRVSEPFKKAGRAFHPEDTVVDCGHGVLVGGGHFAVIAGPYAVEGDDLLQVATRVKQAGARILRGAAFTPRTSPYASQGMGEKGLDLLLDAGSQLSMPVVSEVMDPRDVELFVRKGVNIMQVGAHNAQNFPLLREIGKTSTPVMLKRGRAQTVDELLMAAEYVMSEGNSSVILCERGIRTFETRTKSTFDVNAIPVLKHLSHLPVLADPCHATGYTRYVCSAAFAATAAGADGLEIEVHDLSTGAMADGAHALTPDQFGNVMERVRLLREIVATHEKEHA